MNRSQSFNALIDLVEFDTSIRSQKDSIEKLFQEEINLVRQQELLHQSIVELKKSMLDGKKQVDMVELAMRELDEQEKNKKTHMDHLTDYKEYKSLQAEIDFTHEDQRKQEQVVVDAWNAYELAEIRYMQQLPVMEEKIKKISLDIAECKIKKQLLQDDLIVFEKKRLSKEAIVPEEWMEKYLLMQSRVHDPVVPIEQGSCSSCFYQLTATDMSQSKKGMLVQCKSCFRLLYIPDVMQAG